MVFFSSPAINKIKMYRNVLKKTAELKIIIKQFEKINEQNIIHALRYKS